MSKVLYAGIGSRETPHEVCLWMENFAAALARQNYHLRSGGAKGADTAFENGAVEACGSFTRYRPHHAKDDLKALDLVLKYHPAYGNLRDYDKLLMARNCYIILGKKLDTPVKFTVAWTKDGAMRGGTAFGIKLSTVYGVPVYNVWDHLAVKLLCEKAGIDVPKLADRPGWGQD